MLRSLHSVILGSWANPPFFLRDIRPLVRFPQVGLGRYGGTPRVFLWPTEDSEDWIWTAGRVEGQGLGNTALMGGPTAGRLPVLPGWCPLPTVGWILGWGVLRFVALAGVLRWKWDFIWGEACSR